MNLKPSFSHFLNSDPDRLHFAAHSHHPWPNVSLDAHQQTWLDASRLVDDKWGHIFGEVIPSTVEKVARVLGLHRKDTITFAPNTHEFLIRIFSTLEAPVSILTSDSEFHSFTRQSMRWEEAGLATVERIAAEPYDTFSARFSDAARQSSHHLIYLSEVFYDSGFVVPDLARIVATVSDEATLIVIDGYHAFMARPTGLAPIQDRVFYLAGGYKYAMSGEGVCFLHCPPGYAPRPVNTGWYAGFGQLESGLGEAVPYASDGSRFSGATFDPSGIYRMNAVLGWLESEGASSAAISEHVKNLQRQFLASGAAPGLLVPPEPHDRGNFLTFRTGVAADLYRTLHHQNVITDYRRDRLRIGFGIYHDANDVERLVSALGTIDQ